MELSFKGSVEKIKDLNQIEHPKIGDMYLCKKPLAHYVYGDKCGWSLIDYRNKISTREQLLNIQNPDPGSIWFCVADDEYYMYTCEGYWVNYSTGERLNIFSKNANNTLDDLVFRERKEEDMDGPFREMTIAEIKENIRYHEKEMKHYKLLLADRILAEDGKLCQNPDKDKPRIISVKFTGGGKNAHIYSYLDLTHKCEVGDIINVPIGKYGHLSEAEVVAVDVKPEDTMPVDFLKEYEGEE